MRIMYQIALCDDETEELKKSESLLKAYQQLYRREDFSIRHFTSADELLCMVCEDNYTPDLVFMDIYMPGKPGIDAAKELRKMGFNCRIVFLTTSKEYALEAFRVEADQYLVKPVEQKELFQVLDKIMQDTGSAQKKYLSLRVDNRIHRIALRDIVFCEAQKKCQYIYMSDGTRYMLRMTMAKIYEMLSEYPEFVRAGISYIVNLEHINSLNAKELCMDNEKKIYLPRGSYQSLREKYFSFYTDM